MDEPHTCRKHRLQTDRAVLGLGEWQALDFDVLRVMIRDDDVDETRGNRFDKRAPLLLMAQRRSEFQECAVIADIVFVQGEMIDRSTSHKSPEARRIWLWR